MTEGEDDASSTPAPKSEAGSAPKPEDIKVTESSLEGFVKVKLGDKHYDVPEDGILTLRIDSKDVEVPVKELKRNYQGKVPWERHYGELKKEKANFENDKKTLDQWINKVLDLTKTDGKAALLELVTRAGKNPADYPQLFADELEGLDENSQKVILKQKELDHREQVLAKQAKEREAAKKAEDERGALTAYIADKQQKLGLSDEEVDESWNLLQQVAEEDTKGELGLNKKTATELADLMFDNIVKNQRPFKETTATIKEVAPQIEPTQEDLDFLKETISLHKKRYPTSSKEDVAEIVKAYYNIPESDASDPDSELETKTIKKSRATPSKESVKESRKATSPKTPQRKDASEDDDDDPKTFEDLLRPYR